MDEGVVQAVWKGWIVFDVSRYRLLHGIILSLLQRHSCILHGGWSESKTGSWISAEVGSELRQQLPKCGGSRFDCARASCCSTDLDSSDDLENYLLARMRKTHASHDYSQGLCAGLDYSMRTQSKCAVLRGRVERPSASLWTSITE